MYSKLHITFLGVTTLLLTSTNETGEKSSILIDGFFTRPSLLSLLLGRIAPHEATITKCLARAGISTTTATSSPKSSTPTTDVSSAAARAAATARTTLLAILVAHTHHDHVLDAPSIANNTSAPLLGSTSTRFFALGQHLPAPQTRIISDGEIVTYGPFSVLITEGLHSPGDLSPGILTAPLATPCSARAFKTGECFSFLVKHGGQKVFIHPSANYVPEKLVGMQADVLFLGVGALGKQSDEFREDYWTHVVGAVRPQLVVPIHWDDFTKALDKVLVPLPWFTDRWTVTELWLRDKCEKNGIELRIMQAWEAIDI